MAGPKIPVTVIVTTLNEEKNLPRCLAAISRFDEIIVVDSGSIDGTQDIAKSHNATVINFIWNGQYPKKRQWCLDHLILKHDRVFFVDADEEITPQLAEEISRLNWSCAGYFVDGLYVVDGTILKRGLRNRKLCLFDRRLMEFPVVDDLGIEGMGEIEGHYQPVIKPGTKLQKIGALKTHLLHHACDDWDKWKGRHSNYALWEKGMMARNAYPHDPVPIRQFLKSLFRKLPGKGGILFLYYFVLKGGFLEGRKNLAISLQKMKYYQR